MDIKLKSVQVPEQLLPIIKRIKQRIAWAQAMKSMNIENAVTFALKTVIIDVLHSREPATTLIEESISVSNKLLSIEKILSDYQSHKKNTRDWTQANKLIDQLTKALED